MTRLDDLRRELAELERKEAREHYRLLFEVQAQAREFGRQVMSAGGGWRGSYYGAVVATYPENSRVARPDSWHCHHEHDTDVAAEQCALNEVRRLGAGGAYAVCSNGPDCPAEECRRDWRHRKAWGTR
jgi:hypothetical protein